LLGVAKPPTGGIAPERIAAEVAPLLPLLSELPAKEGSKGDFEAFAFRECFTLLTLLGRRLALLDLTPTSAIQVVRLALCAVRGSSESVAGAFAERAVAAMVEGFVLGREERVAQTAETQAARTLRPLRIDDATFALIVSGVHDPATLSDCVDALGRAMLNADAEIAIVDLTQVGEANRDRAAAVFAADEVTKMLGGVCIFTGIDSRWEAAAADACIPLDAMCVAADLASAIAAAQEMTGRAADTQSPKWWALLDRLRR